MGWATFWANCSQTHLVTLTQRWLALASKEEDGIRQFLQNTILKA
jgi:hypothetical protein